MSIFSTVFSGITSALRSPWMALITLLIVLFFPLELIDYLIYVIVNVGVIVLNIIIWILVMVVNIFIWGINEIFITGICGAIQGVFSGMPCPSTISYWAYTNFTLGYVDVNIFAPTTCLFTIILGLVGISFPIW